MPFRKENNMKDLKDVLIDGLPKKYQGRVADFYFDDGLVDDCMYMLEFNEPYVFCGCESVPVRNLTEAKRFVKEAYAI